MLIDFLMSTTSVLILTAYATSQIGWQLGLKRGYDRGYKDGLELGLIEGRIAEAAERHRLERLDAADSP